MNDCLNYFVHKDMNLKPIANGTINESEGLFSVLSL